MKAHRSSVEDPDLKRLRELLRVCQQSLERTAFGDSEVVRREDSHTHASTADGCAHFSCQPVEPRLHDEADGDIDAVNPLVLESVRKRWPERSRRAVEQRGKRARQVVASPRNNMTNPAPWVENVSVVARYDVQVKVRHGLTSSLTRIEADVVAVGPGHRLVKFPLDNVDEGHEVALLYARCPPPIRNRPPRDDQRVPLRNREKIEDREG
ncbi:unannotated protein [freshwater metagenome]|uniref:Unannotated protein n=1 Tax=freshwater metagenome TaxID=449393 RepID=A0A6J6UFM5_9ZZZZ